MAHEKQKHDFDVMSLQTVVMLSAFGVKLDQAKIDQMNPFRFDPIKDKLKEQMRENDTKYGMDLLGKFLGGFPVARKR